MAEPIFQRVRRVLSASAEDAVDALEQVSGASILKEAIREVDRTRAEVRVEQEAAADRVASAKREQGQIRARLADLGDKARYALGKGRDDLAEAALASQIELEARLSELDAVQADAAEDIKQMKVCLADLEAKKAQMERDLAAFEASRRTDRFRNDGTGAQDRRIQRNVERAQETFDRVMANAGTAAAGPDAHEAEIEALRRDDLLAERMAALRASAAAPAKAARPAARRRA